MAALAKSMQELFLQSAGKIFAQASRDKDDVLCDLYLDMSLGVRQKCGNSSGSAAGELRPF